MMAALINIPFLEEGFNDALMRNLLIPILSAIVLVAFFMVAIKLAGRKRAGQGRQNTEDMLDLDNTANLARNKDIGEEFFYQVDLAALPIAEYTEEEMKKPHPAYIWQKKVVDMAAKKMLRFDRQYTNVELKQMYGPSNLEFVARYEENFTNFIHAMRHWAEALTAQGATEDAMTVLEASVQAGSELSQSYTLLADIYAGKGNTSALHKLRQTLETTNMPGRAIAQKHIDKLIGEGSK